MVEAILMLNGPPRAGKDTASAAVAAALPFPVAVVKVTAPVKDETHRRYGLRCAHDAFEAHKDTPLRAFGGLTPRQAYIATSRDLKERFGDDVVCRMLVDAVRETEATLVIVPDLGDRMEAEWLLTLVPDERALLARIHREGHDFSRDCRDWVHLRGPVRQLDIVNDVQERFEWSAAEAAREFAESAGLAPGGFRPAA